MLSIMCGQEMFGEFRSEQEFLNLKEKKLFLMKTIWSTFFLQPLGENFEVCFTPDVILCYFPKFCVIFLTLSTHFQQKTKSVVF